MNNGKRDISEPFFGMKRRFFQENIFTPTTKTPKEVLN
jgi:hypothetical protein